LKQADNQMYREKAFSRLSGVLFVCCLFFAVDFSACTRLASTSPANILSPPPVTLQVVVPSLQTTFNPTAVSSPQVTTHAPAVPSLQAAPSPTSMRSPQATWIRISRVEVTADTGIYVSGATNLANNSCIQTELLADKKPVSWWPKDVCIQVEVGQWEILVSLGRRGAPAQLDPSSHYVLHAWWPGDGGKTFLEYVITVK
jgi:hypothetical protein